MAPDVISAWSEAAARRGRQWLSSAWFGWAVVAVLTVAAWPRDAVAPGVDSESSWQVALLEAGQQKAFGSHFVYTYGPFGFLEFDRTYSYGVFALGFLWTFVSTVLLARFVWTRCRALFANPVLAAAASMGLMWVLRVLVGFNWSYAVLVAAWLVTRAQRHRPLDTREAALLGLASGFGLLVKANEGIAAGAVLVIAIVAMGAAAGLGLRRVGRDLAAAVGAGLLTVAACWVALGLSLGELPAYLVRQADLIASYPSGLAYDGGDLGWQLFLAAALTALLLVQLSSGPRRWAPAAAAPVATAVFFAFKHAFVVHTAGNAGVLFASLVLIALAAKPRLPRLDATLPAAIAVIAVSAAVPVSAHPASAFRRDATLLAPSRFTSARDDARRDAERALALPANYRTMLAASPLAAFLPSGAASREVVAWTYPELSWRPLPIGVIATSSGAARRLIDSVTGDEGVQHVLFRDSGDRGTLAVLGTPELYVELLCRFRAVPADGPNPANWLLFERRSANACGDPIALARVAAPYGTPTDIPPPARDALTVARFAGTGGGLAESVRNLVFRPYLRSLAFDSATFRYDPSTQAQLHLVQLPVCLADRGAALQPRVYERLTLEIDGPHRTTPTVEFLRIPFECDAA